MSFTCCQRQDETKYLHTCGCPSAQLITKSVEKTAVLCGWQEVNVGGYSPSSPPKKYRKITDTRSGTVTTAENTCAGETYVPSEAVWIGEAACEKGIADCENSASGLIQQVQKDRICSRPDGDLEIVETEFTADIRSGDQVCSQLSTSSWFRGGTPLSSVSVEFLEGLGEPPGRKTIYTLSEQDTELAALDRTNENEGTSTSSILETRTTGFSFTKRTVDYCVLCTGLVKGFQYEGKIPLQKREAIEGSSDPWVALASATFSFTATEKFHIEGGQLNASVSAADFIENNYSQDPEDYGLSADADVIIPETTLDHVQGWEYQVGINPDGDPLYVEKAP